eukprot:m.32014 g.32014  ORF g.32014 m.32014 type:complete len:372 (-) comp9905_c0_seq2:79-1194(-)
MSSRKRSPESTSSGSDSSDDDETDDRHHRHKSHKKHKKEKHKKKSKKKSKKKKDKDSREEVEVPYKISKDDYFSKNVEFSVWLKKKKGVAFEELSTDEARKRFKDFVRKWNDGELSQRYYDGMGTGAAAPARTQYSWGFAKTMDKSDRKQLQSLVSDVGHSTDNTATIGPLDKPAPGRQRRAGPQGPAAPDPAALAQYNRELMQKSRKDFRRDQKETLEELAPRAKGHGHEGRMQKRMDRARERKAREVSPGEVDCFGSHFPQGVASSPWNHDTTCAHDVVFAPHPRRRPFFFFLLFLFTELMRESDLMGGGSDYQRELARRKQYRDEKRQTRKFNAQEKLSEHQAKEKEKMAALLALAKQAKSDNALWQG